MVRTATLCVFLAVIACLVAIAAPTNPEDNKAVWRKRQSWDFLLLVQQWGPGFCATSSRSCSVPASIQWFTMHGLWPNNNDTSYPSNCNNSDPFNENAIESIESQLDSYWPNYLTSETNVEFWSHEFDKHGTCAASQPALSTELKFFSAALFLRTKYSIHGALSAGGVSPSNSNPYSPSQILSALKSQFGVDAMISCDRDSQGNEVLTEAALCIDKYTLRAYECLPGIYSYGFARPCSGNSVYYVPNNGGW